MAGPLTGYTIGITGHRRWEEQAELFGRRGATIVHGPVMHTSLLHDVDATIRSTLDVVDHGVDLVVLTTGIGTRSWFGAAESAGLDEPLRSACRNAKVIAHGPKALSAGIAAGLDIEWRAPGETSEEIVTYLAGSDVADKRVAVQRDGGDPLLARRIEELGAEVVDVPVYQWGPPEDPGPARRLMQSVLDGRIDALTFTCSYAVGMAFDLAPDADELSRILEERTLPVAVGPVTADTLRARGITRVIEPQVARMGSMAKALLAELSAQGLMLRLGESCARLQGEALVHSDGTVAALTPGEARLLAMLLDRSPAVVSKESLAANGASSGARDTHAVEAAVGRLRTKLGPLGRGIRTVQRRGYAGTFDVCPAEPLR